MRWILPFFLCLLNGAGNASGEVYKCRAPNGTIEIANVPCPAGSSTLKTRPAEIVTPESREQAERDVERMREYVDKRESAQRASEAAERQRAPTPHQPRNYNSADECLRDAAQMVLEAGQRLQMENECRAIAKPQTVYIPYPVATPVYNQRSRIHIPASPPERKKPEPPQPTVTLQPRK